MNKRQYRKRLKNRVGVNNISNVRYKSTDKKLIMTLDVLHDLLDSGEITEYQYNQKYKLLCNNVRRCIGIDKVVCLALGTLVKTGEKAVMIFEYPIVATADNFYIQKYDRKTGICYAERV